MGQTINTHRMFVLRINNLMCIRYSTLTNFLQFIYPWNIHCLSIFLGFYGEIWLKNIVNKDSLITSAIEIDVLRKHYHTFIFRPFKIQCLLRYFGSIFRRVVEIFTLLFKQMDRVSHFRCLIVIFIFLR